MLKYKVVDGPKEIIADIRNTQNAFKLFEDIINREAAQGWIFHSMHDLVVNEKITAFKGVVSKDMGTTVHYMLIFCKEE